MSDATATEAAPGPQNANHAAAYYKIASRCAAVAMVFSLIVCALLLYDYSLRRREADPLEATPMKALKLVAAQQPDNEELNQQIRDLDRQLRQEWARRQAFSRIGGWLLLGGVAVLLIAAKSAGTLRRRLPTPEPAASLQDIETQWTQTARWSVAVLCTLMVAVGAVLALTGRSDVDLDKLTASAPPDSNGERPAPKTPIAPPPSPEEIAKWWPRFRGPGGLGVSAYTNVPDAWDSKTNQNILWKAPVPLQGFSSPVVWGNRLFLTGATKDRREVYCYDTDTGKLLWQKDVPATMQSKAPMKEPEFAEYAAPTAVTDGRWVFAIFANGDVVALDYEGNQAWIRGLGVPKNSYGHAASLVMLNNLLLVQLDQGSKKDDKSSLLALDVTDNGKTAWKTPRQVPSSWTTPIVIRRVADGKGADRDQIITGADPWVISYAPADGAELWRAKILGMDVGPSPTFADGLVYIANSYSSWCAAIRPDGKGDVTKTHIVWKGEDGLPDTCSPLASDRFLFLLMDGTLTCYDAKQGGMLWEEYEAFDMVTFRSSPSLVGDRVYLFGEVEREAEEDEQRKPVMYGKTWIIEPSRDGCKIAGTCELDEACATSPAFQDGRIYIRGEKHVFCLGEKQ